MFDELFEKTRSTNEKVNPEDAKKLAPHVRKQLKKDFTGQRLEDAVEAVTDGVLRNIPKVLEEEEWKTNPEGWEELVFDCAAREGY